jgi:hypothetical protein
MEYYTDSYKLSLLAKRIDRLQNSLERIETLGLSSSAGAGISRQYLDPHKIKLELDRALAEYEHINSRANGGRPINRQVRKIIYRNEDLL